MRRLLTILLTALMAISLVACSNKKENENESIVNPIKELSSIEELSDAINMAIHKYDKSQISDEHFNLIDGEYPIAEYSFKDNNREVVVRASKAPCSVDISGIYINDGLLFGEYLDEPSNCYIENDDYHAHRWFTIDGQYVMYVNVNEWDYFEFEEINSPMQKVKPLNWNNKTSYEETLNVCGYYVTKDFDFVAISLNVDHLELIVSSSINDVNTIYEANVTLKDNVLSFDSGISYTSVYDEDKGETVLNDLPAFGSGFIEIIDGNLVFTNCGIEELKDFVFTPYSF